MAFSNIRDLSSSWGFQDYGPIFEGEGVDLSTLPLLTEESLEDLIPRIGPRLKFSNMLKKYLKDSRESSPSTSTAGAREIIDFESLIDDTPLLVMAPSDVQIDANAQNDQMMRNPGLSQAPEASRAYEALRTPEHLRASGAPRAPESPRVPDTPKAPEPPKKRSYNKVSGNSVFEYIQQSPDGDALLKNYVKKPFTTASRQTVVAIIIKAEMKNGCETKISPNRFKVLAQEICEIFPEESASTYYIEGRTAPNGQHVVPKGKLYNRYITVTRPYRKSGARPSSRKKSTDQQRVAEKPETDSAEEVPDDVLTDLEWLKIYKEPWSTILKKWPRTLPERRKILLRDPAPVAKKRRTGFQPPVDESVISEYIAMFPPLRLATGILLLDDDFRGLYPNVETNQLFACWPDVSQKIKDLHQIEDDLSDLELFKAFAALFEPTLITTGARWRPTRVEIVEGFILHVKVISDLESALSHLRQKAKSVKRTLQPLPVIVDNNVQGVPPLCYVVIDSLRYRVESVLSAVDLCFKSFFALHAQYPIQSEGPWLLLQRAIYGIETPWDKIIPRVEELLPQF
ncbi:hypothetical protein QAD02_021865 [Eretmocerus hayati]|uniref:Uncharacterized protein n=1 Tax=Eretmocerus hayati TaxID=131215 RepID=A0ACC2PSZ3_9HYME|nr:hypothetical protein QAD02_021865 [Eretmocerus hayati]